MHPKALALETLVTQSIFILPFFLKPQFCLRRQYWTATHLTSSDSPAAMGNLLTLFWPMALGGASEKTMVFLIKWERFCQKTVFVVVLLFTLLFPAWNTDGKLGSRARISQWRGWKPYPKAGAGGSQREALSLTFSNSCTSPVPDFLLWKKKKETPI